MIHCEPVCYILAAALVLLLPFPWLLSAVTAALVHEFCHLLVVWVMGGKIRRIQISAGGCVIDCGELGTVSTLLSILAGPVGSLSLLLFRKLFPQIAVCGLLQGCFNLLPIFPLDGGRLLQVLLYHLIPAKADAILKGIRYAIVLALLVLILWLMMDLST